MALFSRRGKRNDSSPVAPDAAAPVGPATGEPDAGVEPPLAPPDGPEAAVEMPAPEVEPKVSIEPDAEVEVPAAEAEPEVSFQPDPEPKAESEASAEHEPEPKAEPEASTDHDVEEHVPHVGISVSTFGRGAETARALPGAGRPPATAPGPSQTVPGMPDNVLLQAALAALPAEPQSADIMNVMRQALQGQLFVRAQGDAQALLAAGEGLSLAITTYEDKRFLLVFTGGAPMQRSAAAEPDAAVSVVGQAAHNIFRTAVDSGYDGVYLDHASVGARLVLPIELVQKAIDEGAPAPFELKSLLAAERGDATPLQIAEVLSRVPVWVAGGVDASGQIGLAEARTKDGTRRLEVYSHPLEVIAMGRGDRPLPLTPEQLGKALASDDELTGVVLDAAGPWIQLDRDALAPVLALAG